MHKNKGFTVLELALVILIIGILIGTLSLTYKGWLNNAYQVADSKRLANIATVVQNYFLSRGTVPCPALPGVANDNVAEGIAQSSCFSSCPSGLTCTSSIVTGAIPYKTLGIPVDLTKDQNGNRYSYTVDRKFTNAKCQIGGRITVRDTNGNNITSSAMLALVAFGNNENGSYNATTGAANTCSTSSNDGENCNGDNIFLQSSQVQSQTATAVFDDIVIYALNPNQLSCPSQSTGCNMWFDAADRCTIDLGTSPSVALWYDKSASNLQLAQATTASQPTLQTTVTNYVNGNSYLSFNNDFMTVNSTSIIGTTNADFSHTVVFRTSDVDAAITAIANAATLTATPARLIGLRTSGLGAYYYAPTTITSSGAYNDGTTAGKVHIMTVTYSATTGANLYVDGIKVASSSNITPTNLPNPNFLVVGGNTAATPGWSAYVGDLMEIVQFNRELTSSERINMEKKLAAKWGINY